MSDQIPPPVADKNERTIEELLDMTTSRLLTMTIEEVEEYTVAAIMQQEQILARVPKQPVREGRVNLNSNTPRAQAALRNVIAKLPDEDQEAFRKAQAAFDQIKKQGFVK